MLQRGVKPDTGLSTSAMPLQRGLEDGRSRLQNIYCKLCFLAASPSGRKSEPGMIRTVPIHPMPAKNWELNGFWHGRNCARSGAPAARAIALETEPNHPAASLYVEAQPNQTGTNINKLLSLPEGYFRHMNRKISQRGRASSTPGKILGMKSRSSPSRNLEAQRDPI